MLSGATPDACSGSDSGHEPSLSDTLPCLEDPKKSRPELAEDLQASPRRPSVIAIQTEVQPLADTGKQDAMEECFT